MKLAIFVCVALLAALVQAEDEMAPPSLPDDTRLANGRPAAPRQFPFMAWIDGFEADGSLWSSCGGTLITRSAVLTNGDCVVNRTKWTVRLGSIYRNGDDPNAWTIESICGMHAKYNIKNKDNDIGIIHLPMLAPLNEFIQPVSLPSSPVASSYVGCEGIVAGWGETHSGSGLSDVLRWTEVVVIPKEYCKKFDPSLAVTDRQLCANSYNTTVRWHDRGGPLLHNIRGRYIQIGIASWLTTHEFNTSHPVTYTRVDSFLDWIKLNTESD